MSKDPPSELKFANVEDTKRCSSYAWNHDGNLLALVIDSRQLYIWTVEANVFTHIKPGNRYTIDRGGRRQRSKEITTIRWSCLSNRLVLCYATGQLLLCGFDKSNVSEKFIDNSDGLLKKTKLVEASNSIDIFACLSVANEILVMSFDGQAILYLQVECVIERIKFSQSCRVQRVNEEAGHISWTKIWLSCVSKDKQLMFKAIHLGSSAPNNDLTKQFDFYHDCSESRTLVDFYWLDDFRVIKCYSDGEVEVIELQKVPGFHSDEDRVELIKGQMRDVSLDSSILKHDSTILFKVYKYIDAEKNVVNSKGIHSGSLLSMSDYLIKYYKMHRMRTKVTIELVDEMDLSNQLRAIDQKLMDAEWSNNGHMLAVQLTSGHILIYRAAINNHIIAINGSMVAYMSDTEEVTVLNYGTSSGMRISPDSIDKELKDDSYENDTRSPRSKTNARSFCLNFRPSLLAIGPKHLALALNNRLRFYQIDSTTETYFEEEYPTTISGLSLSSFYVAVQLRDGRLKLQSIDLIRSGRSTSPIDDISTFGRADERYFPDPLDPESIVAFTLTENLLIYSSLRYKLSLFCFRLWSTIQTYDHKASLSGPIKKLSANNCGDKILCIGDANQTSATNVYLYDIYTRSMLPITDDHGDYYKHTVEPEPGYIPPQVDVKRHTSSVEVVQHGSYIGKITRLNQVEDAIWDANRSLLLIDSGKVHVVTILDHTVVRDGPCVLYVGHIDKTISCRTLYASQGVVSFQTCLGKVVNTILAFYDDELQLTKLEEQIQQIKVTATATNLKEISEGISIAKLHYLQTILPIYSLSRCKEICKYLMTEEQFNIDCEQGASLKSLVWKQLASWALFTMNLNFALMLYRQHGWIAQARLLDALIRSTDSKNLDEVRQEIKLLLSL